MASISGRAPARVLHARGVGACIGTLIGSGWWVSALPNLATVPRVFLGALGLAAVCWLLIRSGQLLTAARRLSAREATARTSSRRVWTWFWINFILEIVLLNVAVALLDAPSLQVYWLPAISLVVGLHFLPLAVIFAVPSFGACGAAFITAAVVISAAIHRDPSLASSLAATEALCNALILWATAAWGVQTTAATSQASLET
jgi:hypothetical protein